MPGVKISKERFDGLGSEDETYYPYGTSLDFEDDLVDSLKLDSLSVGDVVEVRALAVVTSKSERESEGDSSKSVGIQLTEIGIYPEGESDNAEKLYGD